jgi:hypothetical protein
MVEQILKTHPDIQGVVLLVDYDPKLQNADLASMFLKAQTNDLSEIQRFHSMCLHGASAVNTQIMGDLRELYRTTQEEGETEDDS